MNAEIARKNVKEFISSNEEKIIKEFLRVALEDIDKLSKFGKMNESFMLNDVTEKLHVQIQKEFESLGFKTSYIKSEPSIPEDYEVSYIGVSWA